jgi:hypothetical protein
MASRGGGAAEAVLVDSNRFADSEGSKRGWEICVSSRTDSRGFACLPEVLSVLLWLKMQFEVQLPNRKQFWWRYRMVLYDRGQWLSPRRQK